MLLGACSSESSDTSQPTTSKPSPTKIVKNETEEIELIPIETKNSPPLNYVLLDSVTKPIIDTLLKNYKLVNHYVAHNDNILFYVSNGNTLKYDYKKNKITEPSKVGLVDSSLNVILEPIYDRIGNPGSIHPDFVEVFKDDKVFLKSLASDVQSPIMDFVFPSKDKSVIGIGQTGENQYKIFNDGSTSEFIPKMDLANILRLWPYDITSKKISLLTNTYEVFSGLTLTYVTPSYVNKLEILPIQRLDIYIENESFAEAVIENTLKVDKVAESYTNHSIISDFYEYGAEVRDYSINQKYITVTDKNNNVLNSQLLYSENERFLDCKESGYRFINYNLIEAFIPTSSELPFYKSYLGYHYFSIDSLGKIKELKDDRVFDFTKYVKIDETYFKGCYSTNITNDELDSLIENQELGEDFPYYEAGSWIYTYINIEALDIMRNEIFASHGYKFTSTKWQKYFSNKPWYVPKFENVDDKLSDIERHNIKTILEIKRKILENPQHYEKRKFFVDYARFAG